MVGKAEGILRNQRRSGLTVVPKGGFELTDTRILSRRPEALSTPYVGAHGSRSSRATTSGLHGSNGSDDVAVSPARRAANLDRLRQATRRHVSIERCARAGGQLNELPDLDQALVWFRMVSVGHVVLRERCGGGRSMTRSPETSTDQDLLGRRERNQNPGSTSARPACTMGEVPRRFASPVHPTRGRQVRHLDLRRVQRGKYRGEMAMATKYSSFSMGRLATPPRLERGTCGLEVRCSIRLS